MKIKHFFLAIIVIVAIQFTSCDNESKKLFIPSLELNDSDTLLAFSSDSKIQYVKLNTNLTDVKVISSASWCSISRDNENFIVDISKNRDTEIRTSTITITGNNIIKTLKVIQLGVAPALIINSKNIIVDYKSQNFSIDIISNIDIKMSFKDNWVTQLSSQKRTSMLTETFNFNIESTEVPRITIIYFYNDEKLIKDSVIVTQQITTSETYTPVSTSQFEKDKKLKILSVKLIPSDKFQDGNEASKTIDGDYSTIYHSPWSGMEPELITLEYTLDPATSNIANYIVLHPRRMQTNGVIKTAKVYVTTEENSIYVEVGEVEAVKTNQSIVVKFKTPVINLRKIKIVISEAYGELKKYFVSLSEFECYESKALNGINKYLKYFKDRTFSELIEGTTLKQITEIENLFVQNIAIYLYQNKYKSEFRVQNYEPYRNVTDLANELKTSEYSQFENPTGMYFDKKEEVVIFVGNTNGEEVLLRVMDFGVKNGDDNTYNLSEGLNVITMRGNGNGYINYYTNNYSSASKIKIHIASGKVNGVFNKLKHDNDYGQKLLDNAVSPIMDIVGERVQLAYSVKSLKSNSYSRLHDLITVYDEIITSEQNIMGLAKYNRLPKNRMFGRVIWEGFMHADALGAAFINSAMNTVGNPTTVRNNQWGIAHEFGHVNQVRPGMKWVGMTECTNNIYSSWAQYSIGNGYLRLEHENVGGAIGNRFNAYLNNALVNNQEWPLQGGPDNDYSEGSRGWSSDHFVKLGMFWQLQLYYHIAGKNNSWGRQYFWADIFEKVRNDNKEYSQGKHQMNFVKNMCDAVQQDLSDFFIKTGVLKPRNKNIDDYTSARQVITQEMIDEAITYIRKYNKPATDVIYYISGNSVNIYKNRLPVKGVFNSGITGGASKQISRSVWKNVVVFETYNNSKLTKIAMLGTGSTNSLINGVPNGSFTKVDYPSGSTRIEAVSYDGKRTLVFGKR